MLIELLDTDVPLTLPFNKKQMAMATLYFRNGSKSTMELKFPKTTSWGEPLELAASYLTSFIYRLTDDFLDINAFQLSCGSINDKGEFESEIDYKKVLIEKKWNDVKIDLHWTGSEWTGQS